VEQSRVRYRVVAFAVALAGVTYLDRVSIGILAPSIMRDLQLSPIQMGYAFSAFTFAYAIFEIPHGVVGRSRGQPRGAGAHRGLVVGIHHVHRRRLQFSGAARRAFSIRRGRGGSVAECGARLLTLDSAAGALARAGHLLRRRAPRWRIDAAAGCLDRHPASVAAGLRRAGNGRKSSARGASRPCVLQYLANTYGFYFFITWLPSYLLKARGLETAELAIFSGLPLLLSVIADITGGMTTDALSRRFGVRIGRSAVGAGAYLLAAVIMLSGTLVPESQNRRSAHRGSRGAIDVHAGAGVGNRYRPRRQKCRGHERHHEHRGPGWRAPKRAANPRSVKLCKGRSAGVTIDVIASYLHMRAAA